MNTRQITNETKPRRGAQVALILSLAVVVTAVDWESGAVLRQAVSPAVAEAAQNGNAGDGATVWGTIKRYTDDHIVVNGRSYRFAKPVIIDTYSLESDDRGNVRLSLDERGRVTHVFFYGIDMPDVVRRYKM